MFSMPTAAATRAISSMPARSPTRTLIVLRDWMRPSSRRMVPL